MTTRAAAQAECPFEATLSDAPIDHFSLRCRRQRPTGAEATPANSPIDRSVMLWYPKQPELLQVHSMA